LGVIFGFVARSQIRRSMGNQSGRGLALAGIIVGLVILALIVAWVAFLAAVNVGNSK
jgi:tetrahydromethanopterin S-methyltransferase subunit G